MNKRKCLEFWDIDPPILASDSVFFSANIELKYIVNILMSILNTDADCSRD